jgi:preprotein translocase subunit SecD
VAQSPGTLRVGRYFLSLILILVALYGLVFLPGHSRTPKLGLDLEGGAQVIFRAKTTNGKAPSKSSMKVAQQIFTERVNGAGVSDAQVIQQGSDRIVVSVPGKSTKDLAGIGRAAQLNFRPVVAPMVPVTPTAPAPTATGSNTSSPPTQSPAPQASNSATKSGGNLASPPQNNVAPSTTPAKSPAKSSSAAGCTPLSPVNGLPYPFNCFGKGFSLPTSEAEYQKLSSAQQQALSQALNLYDCKTPVVDTPTKGMVTCNDAGTEKFMLGSVLIAGEQVSTAAAQPPSPSQGQLEWTVRLSLKSGAQRTWAKYTAAHSSQTDSADITNCGPNSTPCAEFVAFTLDRRVITAPHNQSAITGDTEISGNFTEQSATQLANQLKYGALPLDFVQETTQNVSPTLGSSQLKSGLLAGGIGLVLVVLYSLLYYRGLGFVTIASLLVSGALTYAALVILGREIGFTLTLAGIAGFIVAIGITADSFVVFFERIKDEVHDGRSFRVAVPRAWTRARRTIISADFVSFLAAAVLYYLAAGDVRGFAFTLGMSTVLDLVVVFLFTHPLLVLLSRSPTFGSPRFTGLNALRAPSPALAYAGAAAAHPPLPAPAQETSVPAIEPEPVGAASSSSATAEAAGAAERAAARRGRTVRPEPEPELDEVDDEVVDAEPEPKPRRRFGRRQAVAVTPSDTVDEPADDTAADAGPEPEPVAEPVPEVPAARPTVAAGSTAAERAAARRQRNAPASAEPDPTRPVETEEVAPEPAPEPPVASAPELAPEPEPDRELTSDASEAAPEPELTGAAARAAARRARIRARAASKGGE